MIDVFCIYIGCILFSNRMHISFLKFTTRKCSLPCGVKFSRDLNFADFEFFEFSRNKFSRIWILDFTPFRGFHVWYLTAITKKGGHTLISLFMVFVFSNLPYVHLLIFVVFSLSLWSWTKKQIYSATADLIALPWLL